MEGFAGLFFAAEFACGEDGIGDGGDGVLTMQGEAVAVMGDGMQDEEFSVLGDGIVLGEIVAEDGEGIDDFVTPSGGLEKGVVFGTHEER